MTSHHSEIRKVQITRDEFLRQLPSAIEGRPFDVDGNTITVRDGDKRIEINIESLGTKELGQLDLPMKEIRFQFQGYSESEMETFLENYDAHKLRGAGGM